MAYSPADTFGINLLVIEGHLGHSTLRVEELEELLTNLGRHEYDLI